MNKKLIVTSILSISLLLTSCGKKSDKKKVDTNNNLKIETSDVEDNIFEDEKKDTKEKTATVKVDKELLNDLMTGSDYITRVKIQVDAENKTTVNFIEDYKGDLSNIEIKLPKSLTAGREYLIFYKDGTDGVITPTNVEESFIEIQGSDDGNLNYIEANYLKDDESDKNTKDKDINIKKDEKKDTSKKSANTSTKKEDTSKKVTENSSNSKKDSNSKDKSVKTSKSNK
ncbi:ferlin [Peptoniphilus stercorisuis]|uniref:Lipoprotein n=1 Tax=Peptoniphilus stercorisuis TaxID=1436965 RepID=A0ABS4KCL7_9FIRM|nr:ferlin [Peptoniphilus stercorisuis]MBP2024901.1 hypothetical protein [Peptoniphilus stercorisuis]